MNGELSAGARYFGLLALIWVLFDSLLVYFSKQWLGFAPPVNLLTLVLLPVAAVVWGMRALAPPLSITVALAFGFTVIFGARIANGNYTASDLGEVILSATVFLMTYFVFRWNGRADHFRNVFLFVGLCYAAVCVLALLKVAPGIFPVVNAVWSDHGILRNRPEVTVDQNFQIYYLIPLASLAALPFKFVRSSLALVGMAAALFILAKLQTRSGFLVFGGTVLLALMAPLKDRRLGRNKLLLMPVLGVAVVAFEYHAILHAGALLIDRFHDHNGTAENRLTAFMFTPRHLFDPAWWLPRGTDTFIQLYGYLPHSNITAMYVEGGIAGLAMWLVVMVVPLLALGRLFWQGQVDEAGTLVLLGGIASLIIQLSLNVPYFKQPWLWAGAVVGVLTRLRAGGVETAADKESSYAVPAAKPCVRYATRGKGR